MSNPSYALRSAASGPVFTGTPGYVLTVDASGRTFSPQPGGGGGGGVTSVFGRPGPAIVAQPGDYEASEVTNDSSVTGASVADALDNLNTAIGGLGQGQLVFATVALLAAQPVAAFAGGTAAQVSGFDTYTLTDTFLPGTAADGVNVIAGFGSGGTKFWQRDYTTPATNQQLDDLFVTAAGSDASPTPWNAATPLRTLQEAFNRIARLGVATGDITIHYSGTAQSFDADLTGVTSSGGIVISVVATPTVAATQTASDFAANDSTTNTRGFVEFPLAAYAVNEALRYTGGNTGNALAWVTHHTVSVRDNITTFFGLDASVDNPGQGNDVQHVTFPDSIINASARVPAGFQVTVTNVNVTGAVSGVGESRCLFFNQCVFPNGVAESSSVGFLNCQIDGVGTTAPTVPGGVATFEHPYFTGNVTLTGSSPVLFAGSATFLAPAKLSLVGCDLQFETLAGLDDLSFWEHGSESFILQAEDATCEMSAGCQLWGQITSATSWFLMNAGGRFSYRSDRAPNVTGGTNLWRFLDGRAGALADLPVYAPLVNAGLIRADYQSGTSGASVSRSNLSANIGATNLFATNPKAGLYKVSAYVGVVGSTGTTGALVVSAGWTDQTGHAQTKTIATYADISASVHGEGGSIEVEATGSANITYSVSGIVAAGNLTYSLRVVASLESSGQ